MKPETSPYARSALWALAVTLFLPTTSCSKKKAPPKKPDRRLEHRAGIPILPRGKVVLDAKKGDQHLLEIHARVPFSQAVAFYNQQLSRERWTDLLAMRIRPGLWGISAKRGTFLLTGQIKQRPNGLLEIGFRRSTESLSKSTWGPKTPKDVPVLKDPVQWTKDRYFEASSGRVEIRGRSDSSPDALRSLLTSELTKSGWTVTDSPGKGSLSARIRITRKPSSKEQMQQTTRRLQQQGWRVTMNNKTLEIQAERRLTYHLQAAGKGSSVRLVLAMEELAPQAAAPAAPLTPRAAQADAGVPSRTATTGDELVPLPKELELWPSKRPVLGSRISKDTLSFGFLRPCDAPSKLLKEIQNLLEKRGYKALANPLQAGSGTLDVDLRSITLQKGKQMVVAVVNKDVEGCQVKLMVIQVRRR